MSIRRFTAAAAATAALAAPVALLWSAPAALAAGDYNFSCDIGRYGADPCGPSITVPNGEILRVNLVSSGGKMITFCATAADGGNEFGCADGINPGAIETTVWQNDTGSTTDVQIRADADGLVNTLAQGNYRVVTG